MLGSSTFAPVSNETYSNTMATLRLLRGVAVPTATPDKRAVVHRAQSFLVRSSRFSGGGYERMADIAAPDPDPEAASSTQPARSARSARSAHAEVERRGPKEERGDADQLPPLMPSLVKERVERGPPVTGAFQKLPMVSPSYEIIETALKRADRVGYNKKLKNDGARAKNRAARQLDTLMKELTKPLGTYVEGFLHPEELHPFERALLALSVGEEQYAHCVEGVRSLRKSVVGVSKSYAGQCSKSPTKKEALDLRDEGFAKVESTYKRYSYVLDELKEIAKSLRKLPVVDTRLSTVALVGAPNVGKSSLVQLLSSGLPEIQNYPFTTRSIKMGHFYVNGQRCQVTDTPGLLNREEKDRNEMEMLTLASLQYLMTSVLFVIDLTGECGTSLADQWRIREELLGRFPEKRWIDVFSKSDLLEDELREADELIAEGASGRILRDLADDRGREREGEGERKQKQKRKLSPAELACIVGASGSKSVRVSSMTEDGIDALKAAMLEFVIVD